MSRGIMERGEMERDCVSRYKGRGEKERETLRVCQISLDLDPEAIQSGGEVANCLGHLSQSVEMEHVVTAPAGLLPLAGTEITHFL